MKIKITPILVLLALANCVEKIEPIKEVCYPTHYKTVSNDGDITEVWYQYDEDNKLIAHDRTVVWGDGSGQIKGRTEHIYGEQERIQESLNYSDNVLSSTQERYYNSEGLIEEVIRKSAINFNFYFSSEYLYNSTNQLLRFNYYHINNNEYELLRYEEYYYADQDSYDAIKYIGYDSEGVEKYSVEIELDGSIIYNNANFQVFGLNGLKHSIKNKSVYDDGGIVKHDYNYENNNQNYPVLETLKLTFSDENGNILSTYDYSNTIFEYKCVKL